MPTFVLAYEDMNEFGLAEKEVTEQLNIILDSFQKKGAKILDVKVSITTEESGQYRTYLVLYEAEKPLKP